MKPYLQGLVGWWEVGASFYPSVLERHSRSEKALLLALAEMYVQGVSTAKVSRITEQLCGCEISSSVTVQ